jgi:erythronate-4-phosphate dehydrogenase
MRYGKQLIWCLDVWENEPHINQEILAAATIASPHIAGHSIQSKYRGIQMIYQAAIEKAIIPTKNIPDIPFPTTTISLSNKPIDWRDVILAVYDPLAITKQMKQAFLEEGDHVFDQLRQRFKRGSEFEFISVQNPMVTLLSIKKLSQLGLLIG